MVKNVDKTGKRGKISQAQQYMVLAVFGAAIFLGSALAVVVNSINKISFSTRVIIAQDESIVSFSDTIKNIGICQKPSGKVYNDDELKKCSPNSISASSVPGTLRANIIEEMASNKALASVPNENNTSCINPLTKKNYTYKELEKNYEEAGEDDDKLAKAVDLIMACSSLRVIPDALPAYKNEEALLASVDKIFREAGTEPESLSPTGDTNLVSFGTNINSVLVRVSLLSQPDIIKALLDKFERSIRNVNIERATIEWNGVKGLSFQAQASAYYMDPSALSSKTISINPGGNK